MRYYQAAYQWHHEQGPGRRSYQAWFDDFTARKLKTPEGIKKLVLDYHMAFWRDADAVSEACERVEFKKEEAKTFIERALLFTGYGKNFRGRLLAQQERAIVDDYLRFVFFPRMTSFFIKGYGSMLRKEILAQLNEMTRKFVRMMNEACYVSLIVPELESANEKEYLARLGPFTFKPSGAFSLKFTRFAYYKYMREPGSFGRVIVERAKRTREVRLPLPFGPKVRHQELQVPAESPIGSFAVDIKLSKSKLLPGEKISLAYRIDGGRPPWRFSGVARRPRVEAGQGTILVTAPRKEGDHTLELTVTPITNDPEADEAVAVTRSLLVTVIEDPSKGTFRLELEPVVELPETTVRRGYNIDKKEWVTVGTGGEQIRKIFVPRGQPVTFRWKIFGGSPPFQLRVHLTCGAPRIARGRSRSPGVPLTEAIACSFRSRCR